MKRKRLNREKWGFEAYPYYQMYIDIPEFKGLVCLIQLGDGFGGQYIYWDDMPIAGKSMVCGNGMTWLQLIPDGKSRVVTVKYLPDNTVSLWYVDVIDAIEYDEDGVAAFIDKYLDVIITPQGDIKIDDRDELDEAFHSGELSKEQYDSALRECDLILEEMCTDIEGMAVNCNKILAYVNGRIKQGEKQFFEK